MTVENFEKAKKIIERIEFLGKSTKNIELAAYGGFERRELVVSFNTHGTSKPEHDVITYIPKTYHREYMELIDKIHQAQIKELTHELSKL